MYIEKTIKNDLSYLDLEQISQSEDVVYIVDSKLSLVAFNESWVNFAKQNNGHKILQRFQLGSNITNAITEPFYRYYTESYSTALKRNEPFSQDYECHSGEKFRLFRQFAFPTRDLQYLVITNHLVVESKHSQPIEAFTERFINEEGFIALCANCRKTRSPQNSDQWYWVPEIIQLNLANISHTVCPQCLDFYYPEIKYSSAKSDN